MSDAVVSATFRKTGGPPGGGYGLVIRDQGPEPRDGMNQNMDAYVLETGRVVMSGPAAVIKNDENVRKSYLGY